MSVHKNFKTLKVIKPNNLKKKTSPKSKKTNTLIRSDIDYGILPQAHTQRATDIWEELQYNLKFGKHDNAISVLLRVLLEFAIENYIERETVSSVHINDKLAKKFNKVLAHMLAEARIDPKYHEGLKKFENTEHLLSANTMNKYVHSKSFFPSDHHLKSMWNTLSEFVVICLKV
ncbi:MAG: hypothetical protein COB59_04010 [Rhodospirillaceae bacterium]|nr:MAG: hypothetical protein COB59_04010 [Rhodospirillaceae bacterium]